MASLGYPILEDKAEEERGSVMRTEQEARESEAEKGTGWGGKNKRSAEELAAAVAAPKKEMGSIGGISWYLVSG